MSWKLVLKVDIVLTIPYHYCSFVNYNYFISILIHRLKCIYKRGVIVYSLASKLPCKCRLIAYNQDWSGKLIRFSLHPTIIALL